MLAAFFGVVSVGVAAPLSPVSRDADLESAFRQQRAAAVVTLEGSPAAGVARKLGLAVIELPVRRQIGGGSFTTNGHAAGLNGNTAGGNGHAASNAPFVPPGARKRSVDNGALLLRTSGTTARPKQFVLSHRNLCGAIRRAALHLGLSARDRYLNVMPLFHSHGLMRCLWTIATGGTILCPQRFEADLFFEWIEDFQPTWYSAVPAVHQAVLSEAPRHRAAAARSRLRFVITNSGAMPQRIAAALETELGAPVLELYGCSETCSATLAPVPPRERKPGSVGVPLIDLAIMDETGRLLGPGEVGEIVMRGETVIAGYFDGGQAEQEAFTNGWFRSGDLGYLDEDGFVFLKSRIKETIHRGGEKIAPREIDEVLLAHAAVRQAAAFPVPHTTLEEEVAAVVVLVEGATVTSEEIRCFAAGRLSPQKTPRQILVSSEIPMSSTGKVVRHELAAALGLNFNGVGIAKRSQLAAPRTPLEETLVSIWSAVLGLAQVGVTENLFQLGGNSLTAMQIAARVADSLGIELPPRMFFDYPTIAGLAAVIDEQRVPPEAEPDHFVRGCMARAATA
jgi:acyl-CoA synthetase (AMP-forming)/AMP-acid ligase II/acyl carrier protein